MHRISHLVELGLLAVGLAAPAGAQSQDLVAVPVSPEQEILNLAWNNTGQLKVEMKLDRQEYLAGEMAELTVTVTNPTDRPLLVLRPFWVRTGDIELLAERGERFETVRRISEPDMRLPSIVDTVSLQPGERRVRSVRTDESEFEDLPYQLTDDRSVPLEAGRYRFRYTYGPNATVDFEVVEPVIHEVQRHELMRPESWPAEPGQQRRQWAVPATHLEARGKHFLVVSLQRYPETGRNEPVELKQLAPFFRLAAFVGRMPEVRVTVADDGSLVAAWSEEGGPKRLEIPPAKEPESFHVIVK